jgi:hypothetical protein
MGFALLLSNNTFAMQGRGQGRGPAGARAGSNPGAFPGNRPNDARSEPSPSNNKPESAGKSADHRRETEVPKNFDGFKNRGQYVAARHVSENLGIRYTDLRSSMVNGHRSLGEAIHELRPDLSKDAVKAATKKAEAAAKAGKTQSR